MVQLHTEFETWIVPCSSCIKGHKFQLEAHLEPTRTCTMEFFFVNIVTG